MRSFCQTYFLMKRSPSPKLLTSGTDKSATVASTGPTNCFAPCKSRTNSRQTTHATESPVKQDKLTDVSLRSSEGTQASENKGCTELPAKHTPERKFLKQKLEQLRDRLRLSNKVESKNTSDGNAKEASGVKGRGTARYGAASDAQTLRAAALDEGADWVDDDIPVRLRSRPRSRSLRRSPALRSPSRWRTNCTRKRSAVRQSDSRHLRRKRSEHKNLRTHLSTANARARHTSRSRDGHRASWKGDDTWLASGGYDQRHHRHQHYQSRRRSRHRSKTRSVRRRLSRSQGRRCGRSRARAQRSRSLHRRREYDQRRNRFSGGDGVVKNESRRQSAQHSQHTDSCGREEHDLVRGSHKRSCTSDRDKSKGSPAKMALQENVPGTGINSDQSTQQLHASETYKAFEPFSLVRVDGLVKNWELNGQYGVVVPVKDAETLEQVGCVRVRLESHREVIIKVGNLFLITTSESSAHDVSSNKQQNRGCDESSEAGKIETLVVDSSDDDGEIANHYASPSQAVLQHQGYLSSYSDVEAIQLKQGMQHHPHYHLPAKPTSGEFFLNECSQAQEKYHQVCIKDPNFGASVRWTSSNFRPSDDSQFSGSQFAQTCSHSVHQLSETARLDVDRTTMTLQPSEPSEELLHVSKDFTSHQMMLQPVPPPRLHCPPAPALPSPTSPRKLSVRSGNMDGRCRRSSEAANGKHAIVMSDDACMQPDPAGHFDSIGASARKLRCHTSNSSNPASDPGEVKTDKLEQLQLFVVQELTDNGPIQQGTFNEVRMHEILDRLLGGLVRKAGEWAHVWRAMQIPVELQPAALGVLWRLGLDKGESLQNVIPSVLIDLLKSFRVKLSSVEETLQSHVSSLGMESTTGHTFQVAMLSDDSSDGCARRMFAEALLQMFPRSAQVSWGWSRTGWGWAAWWASVGRCLQGASAWSGFLVLLKFLVLMQQRVELPLLMHDAWKDRSRIQKLLERFSAYAGIKSVELHPMLAAAGLHLCTDVDDSSVIGSDIAQK